MSERIPTGDWQQLRQLAAVFSTFLTPAHKRQLVRVSLWACAVSALEMAVAGAVIPYVQCLRGDCLAPVASVSARLGWPVISLMSLSLFLLITAKLAVQARFNWMAAQFNQQVQRDTVQRLLDAYLHMDWMSFHAQHLAHYFRRCATTAVDAAFVSQQCVSLISSALILVFLLVLMLTQYPLASLTLTVGFLLVNTTMQRLLGRVQHAVAHAREAALQRWNIGMSEAFTSFREVRVYELERFFLQHLNRAVDDLAAANRKLSFLPALFTQILDFVIFGTLLLVVSGWLLLGYPLAELVPKLVFYAVVARVMMPAMSNLLRTRSVLVGSLVNIQLVLDELQSAADRHVARVGVEPQRDGVAAFRLEQVSFTHAAGAAPVLRNVDLCITHPSWLAVVGPSGAGKSTLMELLCGLHQPSHGEVIHCWPRVEGTPERPRVAYLPQHVALIDGSISDNVVFGFDQGDAQRVSEALRFACLDAVVAKLPDGMQSRVGADGGRLSGGERQRLALARALYRHPDLLLLDEATSGLDEETETRLLSTLRAANFAMTVVYITHRTGNLRFADHVVSVHEGQLHEVRPQ